jgi:hypothetical protein
MEAKRVTTEERREMYARLNKAWANTAEGRASLKAAGERYRANNKGKLLSAERERRQSDPIFRLAANIRRMLRTLVRYAPKKSGLYEASGCDRETLIAHIEKQFVPGMTWDNYGEWQIDHRIPLASMKDGSRLEDVCHYTNLQPMWAAYNKLKQDMMPDVWAAYVKRTGIDLCVKPTKQADIGAACIS